jgi:opacity protein-like surface antigen
MMFKHKPVFVTLALVTIFASLSPTLKAQSAPAATQQLQFSAFLGGTGTFTDFYGGKNLALTAGVDLTDLHFSLFRPAVEIRGTIPVFDGQISSQKSFLIGPKVEFPLGRFHPYADFLIGRGQINYYSHNRFPIDNADLTFINSNSTVYSPGVGVDYHVTHNLAVKADLQFQRWAAPPVPSGTIHPVAVTLGGVYTFDFNPHHRHDR